MNKDIKSKVVVVGGPSGVGESTITKAILKYFPNFTRLVTATTRRPRLKEKMGVDYYYFSVDEFKEKIKQGEIIEYTYIDKRDVYYGSYKPDLEKKLKQGFDIVVNPDIVGAKYYKKEYNAITIFIMPDSIDNLRKRQLARDPKITQEELDKRLEYAKREIVEESGFYDYIVVNRQNKLQHTITEVLEIIKKNY